MCIRDSDYVLKPFTPGILKAKVSSLINGRQTLKQKMCIRDSLRPRSFGTFKSNRSVMGFDHLLHDGESHLRSRHIMFLSLIHI